MSPIDHGTRLLETAARWRMRVQDGADDPALVEQFEAWLSAHPRHRLAYERVALAVDAVDAVANSEPLARWRSQALARGRTRRRPALVGALAASVAALVVVGVYIALAPAFRTRPDEVYATRTGEIREVQMADGTRITLDGASRIAVGYTQTLRRVKLVQGQARFRVAHNSARPFEVLVGRWAVLDAGTDFNIDRLSDRMTVTLLSGRVLLTPSNAGADASALRGAVEMRPGERLSGGISSGPLVLSQVTPDEAVAWQRGQILLDNETLTGAAGYLGRHSVRPIRFADARVANLRISGAFSADDPEAFAQAAAALHDLNAAAEPDGSILIGEPSPAAKK